MVQTPKQVILFGSPGTGKSRHVVKVMLPEMDINPDSHDCKRVVFHPEYSYGDFMGKLMPLTEDEQVQYRFYPGHFMKALARAYRNLLDADESGSIRQVALVIDEINRGNSAAIFGSVFQLLDRSSEEKNRGWSEYRVQLSEMEFKALAKLIGIKEVKIEEEIERYKVGKSEFETKEEIMKKLKIEDRHVMIPPNLSFLATMNTSDNSIYHMDAAFKRRWAWQYMDIDSTIVSESEDAFTGREKWEKFVDKINGFIRYHHRYVRRVEDKQIGYWFLKGDENETFYRSEIQNKVMFFLWDSVFTSSKKPLAEDLFGIDESKLVTFGSFAAKVGDFVEKMQSWNPPQSTR